MSFEHVQKLVKDNAIEFIDLRFTDLNGVQHHVSFPASIVEPALFPRSPAGKASMNPT
jgi:glutamine synthetase